MEGLGHSWPGVGCCSNGIHSPLLLIAGQQNNTNNNKKKKLKEVGFLCRFRNSNKKNNSSRE